MLNRIDIILKNKICNCDNMPYSWAIENNFSLCITCKNCSVKISIPYNTLKARISLEDKIAIAPPPPKLNNKKHKDKILFKEGNVLKIKF